jgi:ABC-type transport system involved in cytochrome c biogenesis permease component
MSEQQGSGGSRSRGGWQVLLIIPIVVPLLTFLYNAKDPYVLGFPRFYWLQLAFIVLGVAITTLVYQLTKDRGDRT